MQQWSAATSSQIARSLLLTPPMQSDSRNHISTGPERLQRVFDMWQMDEAGRFTLSVCRLQNPGGYDKEKEKYGLVWKHREVFERAFNDGGCQDVPQFRADTLSWQRHQVTRCCFRVEKGSVA